MKRLVITGLVMLLVGVLMSGPVFASEDIETSVVAATVNPIFAIEFYPRVGPYPDQADAGILYPDGQVTFPAIDPLSQEAMVYSALKPPVVPGVDAPSDVGVLCFSNTDEDWGLKIHMVSTTVASNNFVVYLSDPTKIATYRNTGESLGGGQKNEGWHPLWKAGEIIYKTDSNHKNTPPWGTLLTFTYAIIPSGQFELDDGTVVCNGYPLTGVTHDLTIFYTMTTTL